VSDSFAEWQERVRGKNISEVSLLATDYLNHFNEVVMLLGMVPDLPEMIEDAKAWRPKSYSDHFRDSGFAAKDIAIAAYTHSPPQFREPFDRTVRRLEECVTHGIERLQRLLEARDDGRVRLAAEESVRQLHGLIETAAVIINGTTLSQAEIDRLIGEAG
jgi:hypothetical protein